MKLTRLLNRAIALGRGALPRKDGQAAVAEHLREQARLRAILEAMAAGTWKPSPEERAAIEKRRRAPMTPGYQRILEKLRRLAGESPDIGGRK